ncbi:MULTISPECIES: relaxase/mobilization nuclease domain-containing protein [unclassified Campylobacter]|uniref:relaxase/mobilization nuclease domain-containing protein n=1 Tax=unclassified Campylobacter TaxID=2593542 RepID=UPI001475C08A|nr:MULTISPECIES: relaxase/mobilization nuclease domain-containing protein [unclassified Campylobacter]
MLVKFFSNKQGGSISGINYLLNHRVKDQTARVLKGNEAITRNIVSNITKKQKLCMDCLSFEEKDIDLSLKQTIIDEFETLLFGNDKDRYNILWVEHIDKGRLELNFAIPKIDLITGLAFNPYYDRVDRPLVDSWQNYINFKFGFTDPKDPVKAHILQGSRKELKSIKDYIELEKILVDKLINNEFSCRDDILKALKNSNIEVTRIGKDYISVKLPNSKKAKRFKGDMFHESFTDTASLEQLREKTQRRAKEFKDTRDGNNAGEQEPRSFIFENEICKPRDIFSGVAIEKFRIIKFKQSLSKRDQELSRLKTKLNNAIQKRNNWLQEQSSREPRRNSNISNIISDNIYSDSFYINMELQPLFGKQKTQTNKSKYENLYKTKYNWQTTINDKTKIFTTRMYHDTTRARVIKRIRDKREARERENRIIKRTTQRIQDFGQEINRLRSSIQRTNSNTTRISKFISGFRRKIDVLRELSFDIISRVGWVKREARNLFKLKLNRSKEISKKRDISDMGFG